MVVLVLGALPSTNCSSSSPGVRVALPVWIVVNASLPNLTAAGASSLEPTALGAMLLLVIVSWAIFAPVTAPSAISAVVICRALSWVTVSSTGALATRVCLYVQILLQICLYILFQSLKQIKSPFYTSTYSGISVIVISASLT